MSTWGSDYTMSWKSGIKLGVYFGIGFCAVAAAAAAIVYHVVTQPPRYRREDA